MIRFFSPLERVRFWWALDREWIALRWAPWDSRIIYLRYISRLVGRLR